jgi:hypothetical protein
MGWIMMKNIVVWMGFTNWFLKIESVGTMSFGVTAKGMAYTPRHDGFFCTAP